MSGLSKIQAKIEEFNKIRRFAGIIKTQLSASVEDAVLLKWDGDISPYGDVFGMFWGIVYPELGVPVTVDNATLLSALPETDLWGEFMTHNIENSDNLNKLLMKIGENIYIASQMITAAHLHGVQITKFEMADGNLNATVKGPDKERSDFAKEMKTKKQKDWF